MRIPDGDLVPARRRRYRGGYGRRRFVRRRRTLALVALVVLAGAAWLLARDGRPLAVGLLHGTGSVCCNAGVVIT